jgi:flagellar protein FlgJ
MTAATGLASLFSDSHSLSRLKAGADASSAEAVQEVGKQFEALYVRILLQSMRSAGLGDGLFDSGEAGLYRDLFDQQVALTVAKQGQMGIGDLVARSLSGDKPMSEATASMGVAVSARQRTATADAASLAEPLADAPAETPRATAPLQPSSTVGPVSFLPASAPAAKESARPSSPEAFVRKMWPHAQRAAARLGQDPEVLIAQAALESAWGKSVPRSTEGSSHNLFGIKADRGWQGPRVVNSTLEFVGGVAQRRQDGFRVYASYAESFDDYARFLESNPRYRKALNQRGDGIGFVRGIHAAGYATDPSYSAKIEGILRGPVLNRALADLKSTA